MPGSGRTRPTASGHSPSAQEKVTVPAGTFDACRIDRDLEIRGNNENEVVTKTHLTTWYAPAVHRFVRRQWTHTRDGRMRGETAMELVSFSRGARLRTPQTRRADGVRTQLFQVLCQ